MSTATLYIFGSVLLISLISLVGIALFLLQQSRIEKITMYIVSFSAGTLLGNVFLHILPELTEKPETLVRGMYLILTGIIISFLIEKLIHWRHCHDLECHNHIHPVGIINLIGDAAHNFIDGLLIAGSFLVSIPLGITTTISVAMHEIPQEIGDFAVLLYSGFSKNKAIFFNLLSALTAVLGATLVLLTKNSLPDIGMYMLPLAAGNFIYIAGSDLIPELHKETRIKRAMAQLLFMIAGMALMYSLTTMNLPH